MILLSLVLATLLTPAASTPPAIDRDSFVVRGTITDGSTQRPLVGATVLTSGRSGGTVSGNAGRYRLALGLGSTTRSVTLVVRMIGYSPVTRHVAIAGNAATVDVALLPSPSQLGQVVVAGAPSRGTRAERFAAAVAPMTSVVTASGSAGTMVRSAPAAERRRSVRDERSSHDIRNSLEAANREQYAVIAENPFLNARRTPLSTFAIDVDRASYSDVRRYLDQSIRPPRDAVRIEELVNYFHYDYRAPARGTAPLDVTVETHAAPWQPSHRLIRIGMQAQRLPIADLPPANLVFLVDVSGSMGVENKLPLVIKSLRLLTQELRPQDRVAIAVYAGAAGLVLPSTLGSEKSRIFEALDRLESGGSTNGGAGIRLAYNTARAHFMSEGANRVILATDGDFNVGTTSDSDLIQLIETERKSGVFLTVLGFGMGNTQHAKMEQLADKGNGQFAYIDNLAEAQKALVREMGGTLFTLARDVKIQVEFNPSRVRSYRLIGYENRLLRDEDFNDDTKDAGELGAGHSVTALYDVELVDGDSVVPMGTVDPSRYTAPRRRPTQSDSDELAFVKVRYQPPQGGKSALLSWPVRESAGEPTTDYVFASAVAGFGMLLRESEHKGTLTWADVRRLAARGQNGDRDSDRAEFLRLVGAAERVMTVQTAVRER
jgi:Ca-activated chloride channel family protein